MRAVSERRAFVIESRAGRTLRGTVDLPAEPGHRPTVVCAHGFKGFQEWGFFPYLGELLAERGFVVVRFNFSGSGMLPGEELVSDLEAFRTNTVAQELAELEDVLAALEPRIVPGRVDLRRLALFGHSRGGAIALLTAARPDLAFEVRALVTWAAISSFERIPAAQVEVWRRAGVLPILNLRTGQQLELGLGLLDDVERNRAAYDLLAAAARRRMPWLIVHGTADDTVPHGEGIELDRAAAEPREVVIVPDGDHGLGGRHPFPGPRPPLIQALNATQRFLLRELAAGPADPIR